MSAHHENSGRNFDENAICLGIGVVIALPAFVQAAPVELECVAFTCGIQNPFFKLMGDAVRKAARDIGGDRSVCWLNLVTMT